MGYLDTSIHVIISSSSHSIYDCVIYMHIHIYIYIYITQTVYIPDHEELHKNK
jgi:hypothetical protein